MFGYKYRCSGNGTDYSLEFIVKFGMTWVGAVDTDCEEPANWGCKSLPDASTDVIIDAGKPNYSVLNSNTAIRSLHAKPGTTIHVNNSFTLTIVK